MPKNDYINGISTNLNIVLKLSLFKHQKANWSEQKTKSEYTIWSIYEGTVWIKYNKKVYSASAGDVIFFYPGMNYHAYTDEAGTSFVFQQFSLETGNGIDILKDKNFAGIISDNNIKNSVLEFCKRSESSQFIYQHISISMYADFLSYFSMILNSIQSKHICLFADSRDSKQTLIQQILFIISQNYNNPYSIKELSSLFNMSEKYFITYFKFHVGLSPKQYIIMCRMKKAMELLTISDMKISEIALALGYSDQYCFSKAFQKYFHESPTAFRRQFPKKPVMRKKTAEQSAV